MEDNYITLRELLKIEEDSRVLFTSSTISLSKSDDILKFLNSKLIEYISHHNKSIEYTV